jgi:hypothetical protein
MTRLDLFGAKSTCIPNPDNITGLYYVLDSQTRGNVTEDHPEAALYLEPNPSTHTRPTNSNLLMDGERVCNSPRARRDRTLHIAHRV